MPTATAHIPTARAGRYLGQLCGHLNQMGRMRHRMPRAHDGQPPAVTHVEWSDTAGTIRFAEGTCTLQATADMLTVRAEADDEDALRRLQDGMTRRLETIGRRDRLTVRWQSGTTPEATTMAQQPRRHGRTLLIVVVAALAIAAHLGLLGGALASSAWASWGADVVLAIILLKVIAVAAHVALGRTAFRHRRAIRRRGNIHDGADNIANPRPQAPTATEGDR
ncbi:DUF2218 domain-containing protein [Kutzneria buriramensis]|uniref:DUF2218 domain-containing protein n=1 Tax=Kutzneria buriramensis TaxID=1045776 RepID=A0A3E0HIB9_9PSEU|nr:DUF2218 domain-containing protein [Kutzneria buriramensis]REH46234.1 hypothetical protein BCF44_107367 [Kutzneria buriramensis]